MKTIKRFDLSVEPAQTIQIPFNSEIVGIGQFSNKPALWVLVDTNQKLMDRKFVIVSEDKELSERLNRTNYLGRFEHKAEVGSHVLHLFEE